ncbi:MAG TPA: MFS transporter [Bryobacteraceae bacterium]|nr:MFS transporter [Bryobacteraceae bacterium]
MLILAAVLSIFVYGMTAAMLGTILPDFSTRFQLTPKQNGTIAFCQALGLILASIGVGPLVDYEGKKIGLVLGLILIAIAAALLPRSSGFHAVAWNLFLLGTGGGIIVTAANALGSDVDPAHRATALNLLNIFFGLGGFATPFILANLLAKNSTRLCRLVSGLALVTIVITLLAAIPPPTAAQSFVFSDIGAVLGRPVLWLCALLLFLYVACEVGVWNWLVQHLIAQGIPQVRALNVLSFGFALGLLLGRLAASQILISVPGLTVTLAASILMAIMTFAMLQTRDPTIAWILTFLAGVSMAPVFPTTVALIGDRIPRMPGTAIGIAITASWIGLAVSSRAIGSIAAGDSVRLKKALLLLPGMSVVMIAVNLALRALVEARP